MMKSVTKEKVFHVLKLVLLAVTVTLVLLSLLGTVAHASGLVDDTVNTDNLYSKYPLSNYQLDFYVDNSWSWLPWNWLDGIGKSVQYGLYCITNFVWTISLYLSNATGYVVQQAYKLDFINDMADGIGKSIQTLAGVTEHGFSSSGFYVGFLLIIILIVGVYTAYTGFSNGKQAKHFTLLSTLWWCSLCLRPLLLMLPIISRKSMISVRTSAPLLWTWGQKSCSPIHKAKARTA